MNTDIRARSAAPTSTAPGVEPSFITGVGFPTGLAVDGAHIYWANRRRRHDRPRQPRRHRGRPGLHRPRGTSATPASRRRGQRRHITSTGIGFSGHIPGPDLDRLREHRRHRRQLRLHHRRATPETCARCRPRLLDDLGRHRGAPTSTAPRRSEGFIPAHGDHGGRGRRRPRLLERWRSAAARSGAPTSTAPARTRPSSPARCHGTWRSTARRPARLRPRRVLRPLRPLRPTTASASAS